MKLHLNVKRVFFNKHIYQNPATLVKELVSKTTISTTPSKSLDVAQGAGGQAALHDRDDQDAEHGERRPQGGERWSGHDACYELRLDLLVY